MSRTEDALIARGVDTDLARKLYEAGETLTTLQQKSEHELHALGIQKTQIESILDSQRPSIPSSSVHQLLWESRRACVLCRGENKSVILHHIVPWSESRSHDETNLVVLCLEHHGEAHTKRELSLNISASELRHAKEQWLATVRAADAKRMTSTPAIIGQPHWDYINFGRLEPILHEFEIDSSRCWGYDLLLREGVIAASGAVTIASDDRMWRLQYLHPNLMRAFMPYMTHRIRLLLETARWRELPRMWNRVDLAELPEGTLFADYGGYRFKNTSDVEHGPGQARQAQRQADRIVIAGVIDAYDAISTSAHNRHLSGSHRSTSLGFVRGCEREGGRLRLDATFLAFGTGFGSWSIPNAFVQQKTAERKAEAAEVLGDLFRGIAGRSEPSD